MAERVVDEKMPVGTAELVKLEAAPAPFELPGEAPVLFSGEFVAMPPTAEAVQISTGGRRDIDDTVVAFVRGSVSIFFWIFGLFLESKPPHKPSVSRVSWFLMVVIGLAMFAHEMLLTQCAAPRATGSLTVGAFLTLAREIGSCGVAISNAAWQAWSVAFGACSVAVFGPRVADYWKNGGTAAIGTIAGALRDPREPSKTDDERVDK